MSTGTLTGLPVLVTRPAHQSAPLLGMLEAAGAIAHSLPLLAIAAPQDPAAARAALRSHSDADLWIFTSANAVEGAVSLHAEGWPNRLLALGQGSTRALARHGHAATAPEGGRSEDLLQWPELTAVQNQRLLIVTGEGGRRLLGDSLAARGATVTHACCYRRERVAHAPAAVAQALADSEVLLLTSGEALEALLALAPVEKLAALALLLPSPRVAAAARAAGFSGPILLPAAVSDAALVRRLEQWQRAPHNDCPQ